MKKVYNVNLIFFLLFVCIFVALPSFAQNKFYAQDDVYSKPISRTIKSELGDGNIIDNSESGIEDPKLYELLLNRYNSFARSNDLDEKTELTTRIFCDIGFEYLDLSDSLLTTLEGFQKLEFDDLTSLNLSYNQLTEITASQLYRLNNFVEELNVSNNKLISVKINNLRKLHTFIANNNNLSEVDLSNLVGDHLGLSYANISANQFSVSAKLILPDFSTSENMLIVDALFNNFSDISTTHVKDKFQLNLGVQGLNVADSKKLSTSSQILFFKTEIEDFLVIIKNLKTNQVVTLSNDDADVVDLVQLLKIGEYNISYKINGVDVYDELNYLYSFYIPLDFTILPSTPTYKLQIGDKYYEPGEIDKLEKVATLHFYSSDENAKIYYSRIYNDNWVEGNSYKLTQGGKNYIFVKSVVDGVESEIYTITINARVNLYISNALLFVIILGILFLFLFGLIPLIRKYILENG